MTEGTLHGPTMPDLLRTLEIGGVKLPNNLVLSPMAGFSDLPFRVLCREHGAGLVCTEMVSAVSLLHRAGPTLRRMKTLERERPVSIQVFGTDPDQVAEAAREVENHCDLLGFNMGCPAYQIKRQGCGAALLDHPERALSLVEAIKGASRKPLIAKMRAGNGSRIDTVRFARGLERAGADAIIFHARTAAMGYSGRADWQLIREMKEAVGIPVIGNGDVVDGPSARRALLESGCDGLALGRATLGNPRVFAQIAHELATGEPLPEPSPRERLRDLQEYVRLSQGTGIDLPQLVAQAQQFTRGIPGSGRLRTALTGRMPAEEILRRFEEHVLAVEARRARGESEPAEA
ncbi:MAG TPA: tRNA-dihydrouridine synthase family protein [Candidatus Thermoplasmatota archaeon]|nr:tRNA-dihydrouridine synthase family protein [Candidatus Thermoplasmatota archaeon]